MATHIEAVITIDELGFTHRLLNVEVPAFASPLISGLAAFTGHREFTAKVELEEVEDATPEAPESTEPVANAEVPVADPSTHVQAVDAWGNPVVTS